jgi:hypothetical protein
MRQLPPESLGVLLETARRLEETVLLEISRREHV